MATMEEAANAMQTMVEKINEVGPFSSADWGGSIQFVISDLNTGWLLKMAMDGTVENCEEKIDEDAADGVLEMDSDTWVGINNKTVPPMEAYTEGKMKSRKSDEALMKVLPATM